MTDNSKGSQSYVLTRWLFFRLLGVVHLMAFGSYAFQIIGLNGAHGILPTQDVLVAARQDPSFGLSTYWLLPTVAWLNCSDTWLQAITWAGTALSFMVMAGVATGPCLVLLAILWLSLVTGGGEFTGFQSDGMLVEATFLSLFFVPWQWFEPPWPVPLRLRRQPPPSRAGLLLLRFMIFRMMLVSGLVKILSGDPTWTNFTAMDYHFETQPIPTPLAWYAYHWPHWIHKLMVAHMYAAELLAPLLIFSVRPLRLIGAALMASLHAGILISGNYTFLNYLSILLCLPLVDDKVLERVIPEVVRKSLTDSLVEAKPSRIKLISVRAATGAMLVLAASVMGLSIAPQLVPDPLTSAAALVSPFHIADSYGLFAVMTTSRPEIVFEGSRDGITWQSYEFKYKPGDDLKRPPPWVAPHMPRLDWRLWFAAMVPAGRSPWVLQLVERMLSNTPEIQIFFARNPFKDAPPKYIRAFVYDYHFTDEKTKSATGDWWWRDNKQEYLKPVCLEEGQLVPAH